MCTVGNSMTEAILSFFRDLPPELTTLIIAAIPVIMELLKP